MFYKRIILLFVLSLLLVLSVASGATAAPPQQGGIAKLGETLDLDDVEDTQPPDKTNLGTIMSGRKDGDTLDEDTPDDTTEPTAEPTREPTEPTTDPTAEPTTEPVVKEHPVASAIAEYFGVTYDEVMTLHEDGFGFGNITRAYFFADKFDPPLTPMELLDAAHGTGWGKILKENGLHHGSVGNANGNRPEQAGPGSQGPPGQLKKDNNLSGSTNSELAGQSGNNGNGKGNNGQNNGANNGNGHGRGGVKNKNKK